ncbi:DUF1512 domain-containing protein [Nitrososphaera sp.]|uniref:DUF1512 domain-containing protein n=1 Tax=Nitrososphaera sp. TaxID=1971748 RepID=UPI002ED8085E
MTDFFSYLLQLGGLGESGEFDPSNPLMYIYIISLATIPLFMMYGQRMQGKIVLGEISKSLVKLKGMRDNARLATIEYVKISLPQSTDPAAKIDKFLEYFTIMPVDIDPSGLVRKLGHVMRTKDERMRQEVRKICPGVSDYEASKIENMLEAASALNMIYKVVRHFYLMGKRTTSVYVLVQLQMVMPILLEEADALKKAIGTFQKGQPIGDGIGPMVVGKMMLGREKKYAAKETVYAQGEHKGRTLYFLKAEGPAGTVGRPGEAIQRLAGDLGIKLDAIIMIDAALKLEGERTGDVAEGIGAAIGGIGVEKYQIEEVATDYDIPVYAVIVKQSILDAITVMRKEIADSFDKVTETVHAVIEDKTREGQSVMVIGVGNTMGVAQ